MKTNRLSIGALDSFHTMEGVPMRSSFAAIAVAFLLVAAGGEALASRDQSQRPAMDYAVGRGALLVNVGTPTEFRMHFSFSARNDNASGLATGRFTFRNDETGYFIRGKVICLAVEGSEAFIVSEIVAASDPLILGFIAGAQAIDSGIPGGEGDAFHLERVNPEFEDVGCSISGDFAPPIASGNINVHDEAG